MMASSSSAAAGATKSDAPNSTALGELSFRLVRNSWHCHRAALFNSSAHQLSHRSECQVRNYSWHKKTCGKRLSETLVPIFSPSNSSAELNPFLVRQVKALERQPKALWVFFRDSEIWRCLYTGSDDPSIDVDPNKDDDGRRYRRGMLKARDRAIYDKDRLSIGVLAHSVLNAVQLESPEVAKVELALGFTKDGREQLKTIKEEKERSRREAVQQFCAEFELSSSELEEIMEYADTESPDWAKSIRRNTIAKQ